jgi:hypothetical protein
LKRNGLSFKDKPFLGYIGCFDHVVGVLVMINENASPGLCTAFTAVVVFK